MLKELSDKLESRGIHQGPKMVNPTCLISHLRNDNSANGSAQSSQQYHMYQIPISAMCFHLKAVYASQYPSFISRTSASQTPISVPESKMAAARKITMVAAVGRLPPHLPSSGRCRSTCSLRGPPQMDVCAI